MAHLNKKCLCDGVKYSYCPDCSRADALKPSWYSEFCSETCMTLWTTLTKFGMNHLTKSEAKSIILNLDLKPIESYAACVQRDYAKVMTEVKKPKKAQKKVELIEEPVLVENAAPIELEQPNEVTKSHEVVTTENE